MMTMDISGSAYVFTRSGTSWTQQTKLLASDGAEGDEFGCSVSIDGDYAIVGAYGDDDNGVWSGSAYVFIRSGTAWTQQAKLLASDGAAYDAFGCSVSIDGDYAIVGAAADDSGGSAYLFIRSGTAWTQQAKLLASDGAADDGFGYSVSIDGDGSAYVFTRSGTSWTQQTKLLASDGAEGDEFGCSVSIDGDYAIIGVPYDDDNVVDSGSAYVFIRSGTAWTEQDKLLASDGAADEWFGCSVSIDGDYAIVGACLDDDNGMWSGSAYIFIRSGTAWTQQAKLLPSDGAVVNIFGCSVSIDGDYTIVGAAWDDDNGEGSGSAYVYVSLNNSPPANPTCVYDKTTDELILLSVDPNNDQVRYGISWGNNQNVDLWTDYFNSNLEVRIDRDNHKGTVGVIAEDEYGDQSEWVSVTPKSKTINNFNPWLIRLIQQFPILEFLL